MHVKLSIKIHIIESRMYNSDHGQIWEFWRRFIRALHYFIIINVPINPVSYLVKGLVIEPTVLEL